MTQASPGSLEFWFDFSSPYAYFAAIQVNALGEKHGRTVLWRPMMLHAAFQRTGMAPLVRQDLRGAYGLHDWERLGREHGVPYRLPSTFPLLTVAPARMVYALDSRDPPAARRLGLALFRALFERDVDISDPAKAAAVGAELGLDGAELAAAAADPQWKQVLRERTDEALARGVFGSPFFFVDGEGFWGTDRLPMIDKWLRVGGW